MPGTVQEVRLASHRSETRGVALAVLAIVAGWLLVVAWRREPPSGPELGEHQASAFHDLGPLEQGIYTDLRAAASEIAAWKADTGAWPSSAELAGQSIPPFAGQAAGRRGRHAWSDETAASGNRLYLAHPQDEHGAEWILLFEDSAASIWRRPHLDRPLPPRPRRRALEREGWTEIVAFTPASP